MTLNQDASFSLQCSDRQGRSANKGPYSVRVSQPPPAYVSQTAILSDSINIIYNATLTNLAKAERKTFRNDSLISTDTITGPTYSQTISKAQKGNWKFVSRSDTAKVTVPDYPTIVDFSGLQTDTTENGVIGFNLTSRIKDENPEDNPGYVTLATSLDSKTQIELNGDSATITALGDSTGLYSIRFNIKNARGDISSAFFLFPQEKKGKNHLEAREKKI